MLLASVGRHQREERLARLEEALRGGQFGAQAMCDSYIVQLLVLLGRLSAKSEAELSREGQYDEKIAAVLSYIGENLSSSLSVDELADLVHISRYHFMRLFKAQTGTSVHAYVRQRRLMRAAHLIREASVPAV